MIQYMLIFVCEHVLRKREMNLAVIGTTFVDIKGYPLDNFIPTGRNAGRIQQFHGGVGRNIAEDIANMGRDVMMVGLVDEGGIGADVIKHLSHRGVNVDYMRQTVDGMGTWLAIFDNAGEVYGSISKRPILHPICDILAEYGDEICSKTDAILLEIDMDEEIVKMTFDLAQKHNIKVYSVISNITIALERIEYIKQSDCFVCNRQEAATFFELDDEAFASSDKALATIKDRLEKSGLKSMVVTLDSDGAVYGDVGGEYGHCPANNVKVVDTTGAGDSFFAGVSIGLADGKNLGEACKIGNDMASNVIGTVGNVYLKQKQK